LLALCDRVLVMSEGRLTANLRRGVATQETVMNAAVPRVVDRRTA
jgi:rhamnose transport system ATP-binding protein